MEKILITGSTGMLGTYVCNALQGSNYNIIIPDRKYFDLSDLKSVYDVILENKPDIILHLAAETDVDLCERDPMRAGTLNHLATEKIARAARACGSWLLYISSSNVFGGEGKLVYNELDLPMPVNYYGRSKLLGEAAVRMFCPENHLIIRAGWMIGGGSEGDHKFVGKVIKQIREGATVLRAVSDRFGTITPASLLSDFIVWALSVRELGTLHFASGSMVSRLDIANAISEYLSFNGKIEPVISAQFPLSAPRPLSEGIESIYLAGLRTAPQPGTWQADLKKYLATFHNN